MGILDVFWKSRKIEKLPGKVKENVKILSRKGRRKVETFEKGETTVLFTEYFLAWGKSHQKHRKRETDHVGVLLSSLKKLQCEKSSFNFWFPICWFVPAFTFHTRGAQAQQQEHVLCALEQPCAHRMGSRGEWMRIPK